MSILVTIQDAEIVGVEKGNVEKDVERPVMAFSVLDGNGRKVKALLKGTFAKTAWDNFIKDGNSKPASVEFEDGTILEKQVLVSFEGHIREEREHETVIDDIEDIIFSFNYRIVA